MKSFSCQILRIKEIPLSVSHQNVMIVFVLEGSCIVKRFSSVKEFKEGEVFFINKNDVYSVYSIAGCVVEWIELDTELLNHDDAFWMHQLPLMDSVGSQDQEKEMAEIYRDCVFLKNLIQFALKEEKEDLIQEICDALISDYHALNDAGNRASYINDAQMNWILQIMNLIHQNLNQKMSLQDISEYLGMQKTYVATQFKNMTGMTFLECLNQVRLKKAEELLLFHELSHTEIIKECGFSDSKYFYRYFMDEFHMTPAVWKEKNKGLDKKDVEILSSLESTPYLNQMQEELSGLKTETDLYRKYLLLKELDKAELLNKDLVLEVNLLHPDNYIEAAGERMNAWYGFDLMMNEIRKFQCTAELRIHLNEESTEERLDELLKLLERSASRFTSKVMKCWKFVIAFKDIHQMKTANDLKLRIEKEFEGVNVLVRCS